MTAKRQLARLTALSLGFASSVSGQTDWRFSAGPLYRGGMELTIATRDGAAPGGDSPSSPSFEQDDITRYADRRFDDGFVFLDPSTLDYGGDTWYWGYERADQYDPRAGVLTFHRTRTAVSRVPGSDAAPPSIRASEATDGVGLMLRLDRALGGGERTPWTLSAGVSALWGMRLSRSFATPYRAGGAVAYTQRATYTYELLGVVPPPAPYSGTYEGPGPLLPNLPSAVAYDSPLRREIPGATAWRQTRFDIEAELYEFWIGPTLAWRAPPRLSFRLSPRLSGNLLTLAAERRGDTAGDAPLAARETVWKFGAGAQAGVELALSASWTVALEGGYEWVAEEAEVGRASCRERV